MLVQTKFSVVIFPHKCDIRSRILNKASFTGGKVIMSMFDLPELDLKDLMMTRALLVPLMNQM